MTTFHTPRSTHKVLLTFCVFPVLTAAAVSNCVPEACSGCSPLSLPTVLLFRLSHLTFSKCPEHSPRQPPLLSPRSFLLLLLLFVPSCLHVLHKALLYAFSKSCYSTYDSLVEKIKLKIDLRTYFRQVIYSYHNMIQDKAD